MQTQAQINPFAFMEMQCVCMCFYTHVYAWTNMQQPLFSAKHVNS